MKIKRTLQLSVFLALALMMLVVSSVLAFDPPTWPQGIPWPTVMPWPTARPLAVGERWSPDAPSVTTGLPIAPTPSFAPVPLPVAPPPQVPRFGSGTSPADALDPTGNWYLLDAGASVWYKVGTGGVHMDVFLDAEPPSNVSMAIYAPHEFGKPIGRGSPYQLDHARLVWSGGNWRADGDWTALVTNNNPMPVRYKLTSSARDISNKSCYGYWEYIGTDRVYWTICQ